MKGNKNFPPPPPKAVNIGMYTHMGFVCYNKTFYIT